MPLDVGNAQRQDVLGRAADTSSRRARISPPAYEDRREGWSRAERQRNRRRRRRPEAVCEYRFWLSAPAREIRRWERPIVCLSSYLNAFTVLFLRQMQN